MKTQAAAVLEELDAFRQSLEEQDVLLTGVDSMGCVQKMKAWYLVLHMML